MADADVDFIGHDKVTPTINKIEKDVSGLGGKLSGAMKAGVALFAAEKVKSFAMELVRTAAESDKFKAKFESIQNPLKEIKTELGGIIIELMENMLPAIQAVRDAFQEWDIPDKLRRHIEQQQEDAAFLMGSLMPGVSGEQAVAELKRKRVDREREREQSRTKKQDEPWNAKVVAEQRAGVFGTDEYRAQQKEIDALKKSVEESRQKMQQIGIDNLKNLVRNADFTGNTRTFNFPKWERRHGEVWIQKPGTSNMQIPDVQNIAKDMFMGIGRMMAATSELPLKAGKDIAKLATGDTKPFTAAIEDAFSLVSRMQSGLASTPEKEAVKKTAANSDVIAEATKGTRDAVNNLWDSIKGGIPALAS